MINSLHSPPFIRRYPSGSRIHIIEKEYSLSLRWELWGWEIFRMWFSYSQSQTEFYWSCLIWSLILLVWINSKCVYRRDAMRPDRSRHQVWSESRKAWTTDDISMSEPKLVGGIGMGQSPSTYAKIYDHFSFYACSCPNLLIYIINIEHEMSRVWWLRWTVSFVSLLCQLMS